jgi:hypothetical protein
MMVVRAAGLSETVVSSIDEVPAILAVYPR